MNQQKPTMTVDSHGVKRWQLPDGRYHRTDGPAVEYPDGEKLWYFQDKYHRIDGPAVENADGSKEWWLHGINVTASFTKP